MTSHCESNPAQYERNRRFGHLVHALGGAAGGAKLPSVGLCLNASKTVSFLVKGCNDISRSLVSRKAQNNVTLLGGRLPFAGRTDCRTSPDYRTAPSSVVEISPPTTARRLTVKHEFREFDVGIV
ncbi:uncharacterized protein LOC120359990 [Solenopsis invicta]|uniref:uncharacterized protein LOC120359990 n=1 Tax=Solenopsis invicta TaxID=13686 RepID=UPI00193D43D9|nr:uncharacterized protein LOC120359990 [Solenopsis invicta]